uniref:diguanylate cyclase n=1 Tax=Magnetococcus massalia (strain MO-1) TaxID=451514 RepID=A0A1S7LNC2_MAGMO|nr:Conserved protein of unknown function. Containing diguanylate cyclase domain [Candidatus Magnetococcus massalia]
MDIKAWLPEEQQVHEVLTRGGVEELGLPQVLFDLLHTIRDQRTDASHVVSILEKSSDLTESILSLVGEGEPTLHSVVVRLGFEKIRTIGVERLIHKHFIAESSKPQAVEGFDLQHYWRHGLWVAEACRTIALRVGYGCGEEAYLTGLLHDLGKLIIQHLATMDYSELQAISARSDWDSVAYERSLLGMGHDAVGGYALHSWGMTEPVVMATALHHSRFKAQEVGEKNAQLTAILQLADFLAWLQGLGSFAHGQHPTLPPEVGQNLSLGKADYVEVVHQVNRAVQHVAKHDGLAFPDLAQFSENLLDAGIDLAKVNTSLRFEKSHAVAKVATTPQAAPQPPSIQKSLLAPHKSLIKSEIFEQTLEAVCEEFNCKRGVVFHVDPERRCLISEASYSSDKALLIPRKKPVEIPLDDNDSGFRDALRQRKPVLIRSSNSLERRIQNLMQAKQMALTPIMGSQRVHGLIALDNGPDRAAPQLNQIAALVSVAKELGQALEHANKLEHAHQMAYRDAMTKLLNRGRIEELLEEAFQQAKRDVGLLSVAMIDVDYFKKFNDTFGHQVGDNVLKLVASVLKKLTRSNGFVGRYGGEEFIVVLRECDYKEAARYCERIRLAMREVGNAMAKRYPGRPLSVSVGVTTFDITQDRREEMIALADRALYMAKEGGRNKVVGLIPEG